MNTNSQIKSNSTKDFSKRYEIFLNVNNNLHFNLRQKDNSSIIQIYNIKDLINNEYLTNSQKELLRNLHKINFLKENDFDYYNFINLIKKSDLNIYSEIWGKNQKIKILKYLPKKLSAEIFVKEFIDPLGINSNEYFNQIVFSIDKKYFQNKYSKIILSNNGFLVFDDNQIFFQKVDKDILQLIKKIKENRQKYINNKDDIFGIYLNDSEIINLNNLILKLKDNFNLKTEIISDFKMEKSNQTEKVFLVDYDKRNSNLKIYPSISYGFKEIPVFQSIYLNNKNYQKTYQRKDFCAEDDYVLKIDLKNKIIFYADVDLKKEIDFFKEVSEFKDLGFSKKGLFNLKGDNGIWNFYQKNWKNILNLNYKIKFIRDKFNFKENNFKAEFNVNFDEKQDWLSFDVDCYCGENRITLEMLKDYVNKKDDFIRNQDNDLIKINNKEELEKFILMLENFYQKEKNGKFEGKIYHAPELNNILSKSNYYNSKLDAGFKKFIEETKSGKPVEKIDIPKNFKDILRDYQESGLDWFYFLKKYHFAGILADDMGLGKTLQALILIKMNLKKECPSLVVCPKTLLYNWESEAKKFTPEIKILVINGTPKDREEMIKKTKNYDLIITSYSTLQKDLNLYKKQKIKFNYCILDEAQTIKNHSTKNAQTVGQIDAEYRLALTGTPLENNISEIWSIFNFLMPGFLGSYNAFSKKFIKPIMKDGDQEVLKNLREKISCFMLRRTKNEVLKELPPKIENITYLNLESSQNILYQEILANVKSNIFGNVQKKGFAKSQIHILAGLTKLRQVCNHPNLLIKDVDYKKYNSAKLDAFNELVEEIILSGRKVLVFSQFTKMLDILKEELKINKIKYSYLSGKTKNRQEIINKFSQDLETKVFLISLKTGGVGLNLTVADNVIIFDPWWNPSVENQAIDRTHRIGQKKSVNVYRLVTRGTIEEKIIELQNKKKGLFENLVGESKDIFNKLTWEDVQNLFKN